MIRVILALLGGFALAFGADPVPYGSVRSILEQNCSGCHNHGSVERPQISGGLALDSYEAALRGASRPVIVPGKADQSELMRRLEATDPLIRMPKGQGPLALEAIEMIRQWINDGAKNGGKADASATPVDTSTAPEIAIESVGIFVPFGSRRPLVSEDVPVSEAETAIIELPGALVVEEEKHVEKVVAEPYEKGLTAKIGPLAPATALAFTPDGQGLLVGSFRRVVKWDLSSTSVVQEIRDLSGSANSLAFSPDGKLLAVAGGKPFSPGEIRLYDGAAGLRFLTAMTAHEEVILDAAFSPDSRRLATGSFDKSVEIWDVIQAKRLTRIGDHADAVYAVAFDGSGRTLASAGTDRTVRLSDGYSGEGRLTINPELKGILAVAFSPDSKFVLTAGESPEIRWWEVAKIGESVNERGWNPARKAPGHLATVHSLRFSPDGRVLASVGADRTVRLWDAGTGRFVRALIDADDLLYSVAFSPDSKRIAASGGDGLTRVWEVDSGKLLFVLLHKPLKPDDEKSEWLAVTPDGRYKASSNLKSQIRLLDARHAKKR